MSFAILEAYMDAPDAIALTVRDPAITRGNTVAAYQDESATAYDTLVTRNNPRDGGAAQSCLVIGPNKEKLRFADILPSTTLDRNAVRNVSNWPTIGGRTVTAVRLRFRSFDDGLTRSGGTTLMLAQEYTIILEMDGNLPQGGPYTIGNATATIDNTSLTFNDKTTRAGGIRVNQIGYRRADLFKMGVLATRRPGGANSGAVNFASTYGMTTFYVLNSAKEIVFTGSIVQRCGPSDTETGYVNNDVADLNRPLSVSSVTKANPGEVTTGANHGLTTGDKVRFRGMSGMTQLLESTAYTTTVTAVNKFTIGVDTTAFGTLSTGTFDTSSGFGYENLVYPCVSMNRVGTYAYSLDFSAFEAQGNGTHYLYIPDYGISDPFQIDDASHAVTLSNIHKGLYALRRGHQLDIGDYSRGPNLRDDGTLYFHNYLSNVPAGLSGESTVNTNSPEFDSGMAAYEPNITSTRVTLPSSGWAHQDAGDLDTFLCDHGPQFYILMAFLQEITSKNARQTSAFTVSNSADAIGSSYQSTDVWPALLHECAWFCDFFLNMQQPDGSVYSGVGVGHFSAQICNEGESSDYYRGTDSRDWTTATPGANQRVFGYIYAADHWCNMIAAYLFGKFALLCSDYGNTALASTYQTAAISAYDWARTIRTDATARDNYYTGTRSLKTIALTRPVGSISAVNTSTDTVTYTSSGFVTARKVRAATGTSLPGGLSANTDYWLNVSGSTVSFHTSAADATAGTNKVDLTSSVTGGQFYRCLEDSEYTSVVASLDSKHDAAKTLADAVLFRLLGSPAGDAYNTITAGVNPPSVSSVTGWGPVLEYIRTPAGTSSVKTYWRAHFNDSLTALNYLDGTVAFPQMGVTTNNTQWGMSPYLWDRVCASLFLAMDNGAGGSDATTRDKCLKHIQAHLSFIAGCNLQGICFIKGTGVRNPNLSLHEDSFAKGVKCPDGIIPYGYNIWPVAGSVFNNFGSAGALSWLGDNVSPANAAVHGKKVLEPWRWGSPHYDAYADNRGLISQSEYSIIPTIMNNLCLALVAHAWDGNTQNSFSRRRFGKLLGRALRR